MAHKTPLTFADKSIRQFADNMFGESLMILPADYLLMRTVFRHLRGTWEAVFVGDVKQVGLLSKVVQTWGNNKKDQRKIQVA